MQMGAIGCITTGERKNKTKRVENGRAGHVLRCMNTDKKNNKLAGMVAATRKDYGVEQREIKGCVDHDRCKITINKHKNKQRSRKKAEQARTWGATSW